MEQAWLLKSKSALPERHVTCYEILPELWFHTLSRPSVALLTHFTPPKSLSEPDSQSKMLTPSPEVLTYRWKHSSCRAHEYFNVCAELPPWTALLWAPTWTVKLFGWIAVMSIYCLATDTLISYDLTLQILMITSLWCGKIKVKILREIRLTKELRKEKHHMTCSMIWFVDTQNISCVHKLCMCFHRSPVHTSTRATFFFFPHFTPRLEIVWALLCCSCWFRLPLPLAGSKPAVTLTLALQICSVQQNLSLSLSYTHAPPTHLPPYTPHHFVFNILAHYSTFRTS